MLADVLGLPVAVSAVTETSARGVALLALEALGELRDLTEAPLYLGPTYEPDPARHARYQEARKRQERLYNVLMEGSWLFV